MCIGDFRVKIWRQLCMCRRSLGFSASVPTVAYLTFLPALFTSIWSVLRSPLTNFITFKWENAESPYMKFNFWLEHASDLARYKQWLTSEEVLQKIVTQCQFTFHQITCHRGSFPIIIFTLFLSGFIVSYCIKKKYSFSENNWVSTLRLFKELH